MMNALAYYRNKRYITQREVADILGISQTAVCKWERGKSMPTAKLLPKIASLYRCSTDELLRRRISQEELESIKPKKKK